THHPIPRRRTEDRQMTNAHQTQSRTKPSGKRPVAVALSPMAAAPPDPVVPDLSITVPIPAGVGAIQIRVYRGEEARRIVAAVGEKIQEVDEDLKLLLDFPDGRP